MQRRPGADIVDAPVPRSQEQIVIVFDRLVGKRATVSTK